MYMYNNNTMVNNTTINNNNTNSNGKYIILLLFVQYVLALYILYIWNPYNVSDKYPTHVIIFLQINLLLSFIIYYYFTKTKVDKNINTGENIRGLQINDLSPYGIILLSFLSIFVTLYYIWKLLSNVTSFQTLYVYLIDFLIICGVFGVIYLFIQNKNSGYADAIKEYALAAPFMIINFAKYLKSDFITAGSTVWILLGIIITLIILRFLLPIIIHNISTHDGTELLGSPIYLNKEKILGKYENMPSEDKKKNFSYKYSISFWFYINPQPTNTNPSYNKYTNILNYGNKPSVQFNSKKNKLRVQCIKNDNSISTIYETDSLQYQKWNNMVINYDSGNMDVFINGDLVGSKQNIAPFMKFENVVSGEKRGIEGGICNVHYYSHILSLSTISNTYHLLKNNEIPYIY